MHIKEEEQGAATTEREPPGPGREEEETRARSKPRQEAEATDARRSLPFGVRTLTPLWAFPSVVIGLSFGGHW